MKASKPYFSHDIGTKSDEKIIRLMFDFRKSKNDFPESTLRELVSHAAYGIYWEIIEYLHENSLNIDELDMLADELRIDSEVLKRILNNYELFKVADGKYISERVLRNLKLQEEKSEKARQSVNARHNRRKKEEAAPPQAAPQEAAPEYSEELVMSIIQIYNKKFNKSQIVSNTNKQKIFDIHSKNNLTLEVWEKIFANAKRGWDIGDKKNVPPSLKKILEEWDSFASDDYFLAPDREALARLKAEQEKQEQARKEEEYRQAELERQENQKKQKIRQEKYEAIDSKEAALDYLYNYLPVINHKQFIQNSRDYKEFSNKYDFSIQEVMEYFASRGERSYD